MSIEALVEISRYYGKNQDYVLAGGGNTSFKNEETLYVKGSGMSLADAVSASFVQMDRKALARIWEKKYPESSAERERAVLADIMAAKKAGEPSTGPYDVPLTLREVSRVEEKRPSVETLLHNIIPFAFTVHLHPALVNGLTCSRQGETAAKEIFGEEALWIPISNPGYKLSKKVKTAMDAHTAKHGKAAAIIFLQNHGVFVGGDSVEEIKKLYSEIMLKIDAKIQRRPDFSCEKQAEQEGLDEITQTLAGLAGAAVILQNKEISKLVRDRSSFGPVFSAFTPDHIVYAGSEPLFVEIGTKTAIAEAPPQKIAVKKEALKQAWNSYVQRTGRKPKITAVQGLGVFGTAATEKAALLALDLFMDAVKIAAYAESFGGYQFMTEEHINFINEWEAERFRASVST